MNYPAQFMRFPGPENLGFLPVPAAEAVNALNQDWSQLVEHANSPCMVSNTISITKDLQRQGQGDFGM